MLVLLCIPAVGEAQASGVVLRPSVSVGVMGSEDQRTWLGFDGLAIQAATAVGLRLTEWLSLEGRAGAGLFGSTVEEAGGLVDLSVGGAVSYEPWAGVWTFGSVHGGAGMTGPLLRPTAHAAAGVLFGDGDETRIGPAFFYDRVFQVDGAGQSTDASVWSVGLVVDVETASPPPPAPPAAPAPEATADEPAELALDDLPSHQEDTDALLELALATLPADARAAPPTVHRLIPPVLFEYDSATFLPCGEVALHLALEELRRLPAGTHVRIEGHADAQGTEDYNAGLSRERAERVRAWLVERGFDGNRLEVAAEGEDHLISAGDETRHPLDRRVVFRTDTPSSVQADATDVERTVGAPSCAPGEASQ